MNAAATPPPALPRIRGLPLVGVLPKFARDPLGFLDQAAALGDVAAYNIVDHELVQLNHPELVEQVLVHHARAMHKDRIYEITRPVLGNGLVTSEGDLWRRHRKLLAPSFTPRSVDGYAAEFVRCAAAYADGLTDGDTRDVHRDLMALTQQIVLNTLFGTDLGVDTSRVAHAIERVMDGFVYDAQGIGRVIPHFVRTPTRRRSAQAVVELDEVIYALIAARRRAGLGEDLLSRLLDARDEEGGLTDTELRDEAVTAFVAGHETTALALTYTFVLLGEQPEVWDPLVAELDRVLGDRDPRATDLEQLRYTTAVATEAMRVLPPVWTIGREPQEDVQIGPHLIRKGTQIILPQWVIHHDPRWYPEPSRFRPERWLEGEAGARLADRLPRMAYFPFGGGPRVCIGNHFAMLEMVLVLATVARRVRLCATGGRPPLSASITLRPKAPVPVRVERRRR